MAFGAALEGWRAVCPSPQLGTRFLLHNALHCKV